jgi:MFS family permease
MLLADLARAILALGFLAAPVISRSTLSVAYIYALVVALQGLTSIFNPARSAAIPALVPAERLGAANAVVETFAQMAMLLGPTIGAAMLLWSGPNGVFVANALTFLVSAVFLAAMRLVEPPRRGEQRKSVGRELREGAEVVRQSFPLKVCIGGFALVGALNLCLQATMVDLLARELGRPAAVTGTLLTLVGVGLLLGTWPTVWLMKRGSALAILAVSIGLLGLDTALIGLAPSFAVVLVAFVANGVFSVAADLTSQITIGHLAPQTGAVESSASNNGC